MAEAILCPSCACEPGAGIIGIVLPNGTVAFSKDRILVDAGFVEIARRGRSPEQRFRFSSPCRRAQCVQWKENRCGIADLITIGAGPVGDAGAQQPAPDCPIRSQCRWYAQCGEQACFACRRVITDQSLAA